MTTPGGNNNNNTRLSPATKSIGRRYEVEHTEHAVTPNTSWVLWTSKFLDDAAIGAVERVAAKSVLDTPTCGQ